MIRYRQLVTRLVSWLLVFSIFFGAAPVITLPIFSEDEPISEIEDDDEDDGISLLSEEEKKYIVVRQRDKDGSGSVTYNTEDSDYRFYTEYMTGAVSGKTPYLADVLRRTVVRVYMYKGEIALFGSTVHNSQVGMGHVNEKIITGCDIVVENEDGSEKWAFDVIENGIGYLSSREHEVYGPKLTPEEANDSRYYEPLSFTAPDDGVYVFHFHSLQATNDGSALKPLTVNQFSQAIASQTKYGVAAWDLTVIGPGNQAELQKVLDNKNVNAAMMDEELEEDQTTDAQAEEVMEETQAAGENQNPEGNQDGNENLNAEGNQDEDENLSSDENQEENENQSNEENQDISEIQDGGDHQMPSDDPQLSSEVSQGLVEENSEEEAAPEDTAVVPMLTSLTEEEDTEGDDSPDQEGNYSSSLEDGDRTEEPEQSQDADEEILDDTEEPEQEETDNAPGNQTPPPSPSAPLAAAPMPYNLDAKEAESYDDEIDPQQEVEPELWEVKHGRTWANYLALSNGGTKPYFADLDLYVLTDDGVGYQVQMNRFAPFGFLFFSDNTGFVHQGTDTPIYHSFYGNDNAMNDYLANKISFKKPDEPNTATRRTYKVFFENPLENGNDLPPKIKPEASFSAQIQNLSFSEFKEGVSRYSMGGVFRFESKGASSVTLNIDFREVIQAMTVDERKGYTGSGVVQISGVLQEDGDNFTPNTLAWDGKDTSGQYLPVGVYAVHDEETSKITVRWDMKSGEIHFPLLDAEGFSADGGVKVQRLNGNQDSNHGIYDLYYNNEPLKRGTIEPGGTPKRDGSYYILSDGTRSYAQGTSFTNNLPERTDHENPSRLSTLVQDKAGAGALANSYKHCPVDTSNLGNSMWFSTSGTYSGGGDRAGIDMWTYYLDSISDTQVKLATPITIIPYQAFGTIKGHIFYDVNDNDTYDAGDEGRENIKVRLVRRDGSPATHMVEMPMYDAEGHIVYDADGIPVMNKTPAPFVAYTDKDGNYTFENVPYAEYNDNDLNSSNAAIKKKAEDDREDSTYFVQVMLDKAHTDILGYHCITTTGDRCNDGNAFTPSPASSDNPNDGNHYTQNPSAGESHYQRDDNGFGELIFSLPDSQYVTVRNGDTPVTFEPIGYHSDIATLGHYRLEKQWDTGNKSDLQSLVVQVWCCNETDYEHGQAHITEYDTLMNEAELVKGQNDSWTSVEWEMDTRRAYYIKELYTKYREDGTPFVNEDGSPRLVYIARTLPLTVAQTPATPVNSPETDSKLSNIVVPKGALCIPAVGQTELSRDDDTSAAELHTEMDTDSIQFQMDYTVKAITENNRTINVITLRNTQEYDSKTYYLWNGKETVLPDFITKTISQFGGDAKKRQYKSVPLTDDIKEQLQIYDVKDTAQQTNLSGSFELKDGEIFYQPSETGTHTYRVIWQKEQDKSYEWNMTLYVYDVGDDGPYMYNPGASGNPVTIQEGLPPSGPGSRLEWKFKDGILVSNDTRKDAIVANDIYRLGMYQGREFTDIDTCADLVGIAYASEPTDDPSKLTYFDTYTSGTAGDTGTNTGTAPGQGATSRGYAKVYGQYGYLEAKLNIPRSYKVDTMQDHVDYATLTYTPTSETGSGTEYFYYKLVVHGENVDGKRTDYLNINAHEGVVMYARIQVEPYTDTASFMGSTITIGEQLEMNFYALLKDHSGNVLDSNEVAKHYQVVFNDDTAHPQAFVPDKNLTKKVTIGENEVTLYGFTYENLYAYQMSDSITATLYYKPDGVSELGGKVATATYSIRQYAESMLSKDDTSVKLKNMLVAMLNYGAEAQQYALNHTWRDMLGYPANSSLSYEERSSVDSAVIASDFKPTVTDSGKIKIKGVVLELSQGMRSNLTVAFAIPEENAKTYILKIFSNAADSLKYGETPKTNNYIQLDSTDFKPSTDGCYTVTIGNIPPFFWDNGYRLEFYEDGNDTAAATLTYSVNSYCYDQQNETADGLGKLVKAMYNYNQTAKEWYKSDEESSNVYRNPNNAA